VPSKTPPTRVRVTHERPTLATIARLLGVSRATVSNAYNRPDQLSAELRDRILTAAAEVGYAGPDPAARSLRRGHVGAVGYLLCDRLSYAFSDPAAVAFVDGLAEVLEPQGSGLLILPGSEGGGAPPDLVTNAVIDGLVGYGLSDDDPALAAARARSMPLVVVDQAGLPNEGVVRVDDRGGAAAGARHLVELGHQQVAIVSLELRRDRRAGLADPARLTTTAWAVTRERLAGYRDALEAGGIDWERVVVWECLYNGRGPGRDAAAALLARRPRPTAILSMSDELALGVIEGAHHQGIEVPRDLSVIGFDDTAAAAAATPPLTTVHQPLRRKGLLAGRRLLDLQAGRRPARSRRLPTELVVRASTAPPRRRK
jgi:DNA-binding LacI/PurR family transcriptional regulator